MSNGFGEPIRLNLVEEETSDENPAIGEGWEVSQETHREIEEIESSIRLSELRSGTFLFR
jgi:hypothetical protein